jgi:dTDP-4-dehydrorhamnose 3,5-epimerase-like enzyme
MNRNVTVYDCCIVKLKKIHDRAGNITVVEENVDLPFEIKRVYYLYDVPSGADRGGHAHKDLHHFMVAASGCYDVIVDDGRNKKIVELNRPDYGLYIPPGIWVELINFSAGAISLNLVSDYFSEEDYIRDYQDYLNYKS